MHTEILRASGHLLPSLINPELELVNIQHTMKTKMQRTLLLLLVNQLKLLTPGEDRLTSAGT